ncbi:hypothetical protein [Haloferax sp. DFSO60]|uniref:DUF7523 family protein n=1 Tax=Haloferax sp. DFSO60 TaxID=3388652 RepID=UPI00397B6E79
MSLAADARDAVRKRPFLLAALRAGVVNYSAAAEFLDIGEQEAVAAALRRFAADLPALEATSHDAVVTMRSGVGLVGEDLEEPDGEAVLSVSGVELAPSGPLTAIIADGNVDTQLLAEILTRLNAESVVVDAAGVAGDALLVVVPRRQGATALQIVEGAVDVAYR